MLHELVLILAHLEEVCLLLGLLNRSSTVRTLAIYELSICEERLTWCTVFSYIMSLIYITLIVQLLKYLLYLLLMVIICCTDKLVI